MHICLNYMITPVEHDKTFYIKNRVVFGRTVFLKNKHTFMRVKNNEFLLKTNHNYKFIVGCNEILTINNNGIIINGVLRNYSDSKLKTNITPLNTNITIDNLNPVSYTYNLTQKEEYGFIAQDVQKYFPSIVNTDDKYLSVNYIGIIPILVKEIKELKKTIRNLKYFLIFLFFLYIIKPF